MFRIGIHHTRTLIDRNSHWDRHSHESMIVPCRSYSWHCARHRARCRVRRANLGIFRYRARAYESAAPRHVTFMSGEQLLLLGSPQDHRLYNSNAQPLCLSSSGALSTATCLRRRRFSAAGAIFRRRLLSLHPPHVSHPALPATTTTKPAK